MSDQNDTSNEEIVEKEDTSKEAAEETSQKEGKAAEKNDQLGEGGKKALTAERQARREAEKNYKSVSAENQTLLARVEALEKANAEAAAAAAASAHKLLQLEVAEKYGISPQLAPRLQGKTKEELTADAEKLVSLITPTRRGLPRDPTQGLGSGEESRPGSVASGRELYRSHSSKKKTTN